MSDKSIAELWESLQSFLLPSSWSGFGRKPNKQEKDLVREFKESNKAKLRAELLERSISEYGLQIQIDAFGGRWIHESWLTPIRICGAIDTRNRAAALNFMAWEIEQRQREAGEK